MKIGIIGGGILGISLGYFLTQRGVIVDIYEASPEIGGLAGRVTLDDGATVDRFYHAILSSDSLLLQLCEELGITEYLHFKETRMGFYHQGAIHPMNNMIDFLRFPPLGWLDRFRLGLTVLYAQFIRDWHSLESINVEQWLLQLSGENTYRNIWRPMLKAKFDGGFEQTPATYIWSRLVRMKSTRSGVNQKEEAGYIQGGYPTLLTAMIGRIKSAGGTLYLNQPVNEIASDNQTITGLKIQDEFRPYDAVISTVQLPVFCRLIPEASSTYLESLQKIEYLGVVCLLLAMEKPLSGYWTLNITDDRFPFTGVIETTAYIDPKDVGGYHLVYLPKYTQPNSNWQTMPDEEIIARWLADLEAMLPSFSRDQVRFARVYREKYVEPIHGLSQSDLIPTVETPITNLYLATTTQIYPDLTNGESICKYARQVVQTIKP